MEFAPWFAFRKGITTVIELQTLTSGTYKATHSQLLDPLMSWRPLFAFYYRSQRTVSTSSQSKFKPHSYSSQSQHRWWIDLHEHTVIWRGEYIYSCRNVKPSLKSNAIMDTDVFVSLVSFANARNVPCLCYASYLILMSINSSLLILIHHTHTQ